MSLLIKSESALDFPFGVRAQTDMKLCCISISACLCLKIQVLKGFKLTIKDPSRKGREV